MSDLVETAREAFITLREEIEAIPDGELVRINVDLHRAARRGLVAADRVESLLPIMRRLPHFRVHLVARLRLYALALIHAHAEVLGASAQEAPLTPLLEEAELLRARMLRTADVLVHHGVVCPTRLAALRGGRGHAHVVDSLHGLARLFDDLWPQVQGHVMITREMIARAANLSTELLGALGERDVRRSPLALRSSPRHRRAQAFTLFARAYAEAQRGTAFLRWYERDTNRIVPSLRGNLRVRRSVATSPSERATPPVESHGALDEHAPANDAQRAAVPA